PVELMGYGFDDDDLAKEIVSTVEQEVSSLALLSFTARLLWEGRDEQAQVLTRTAYESFGGVAGAISTHADGVLDDCSAHELDLAHQLLLRLVTPDRRRRVVARPALLDGLPEAAASVLQRFVKARLVSSRKVRHGAKAEIKLELAHESLVKTWPTLARWVEESREQLDFLVEVQQGADLWLKRGKRHDELWIGGALKEALRWQQATTIKIAPHINTFIEASASRARYRRLRKRLALIFAAMALMFLALFLHATNLRLAAQKSTVEKQRSTALTEGAAAAFQQGNYLEARAKLRLGVERLDSSAARALWWQLGYQHLVWKRQFGAVLYAVDFSPDGSIIGATSLDHSVYLLDPVTRSTRVLRGHTDQVTALAFAPNSTQLFTGDWHGTVIVWEIRTGAIVKTFRAHEGAVMALAHWSDGSRWASASKDRKVRIWDTRSGKMLRELQHDDGLSGLSLSPDGKRLVAGDYAGTVHLWDVDSGTRKARFSGHERSVRDVAFSPSGKLIASASLDHTVRIWDVATGRPLRQLRGHRHGVHQVAFSPNGRTVVSAGLDRELLQWNVANGRLLQRIRGHEDTIRGLSFSPDGQYIASTGNDQSVRLWRMDAQPNSLASQGHEASVVGVVFSPDGEHVASASADGTVREWDFVSGRVTRVFRGHDSQVNAVAYSADGQQLASSSHDKTARLWSTTSTRLIHLLGGHSDNVSSLSFSPDGQYVLTGSGSKVHLWDTATGSRDSVLNIGTTAVESITFNSTGERLLLASGRNAHTWQFRNAAPLVVLGPHQRQVLSAFFLPGTDKIITLSADRFIRVWNESSGKELEKISMPGRLYHGDAHPDGRRVAAATSDRNAYIIDMKSKKRLALRGHAGEVNHVRFSHDGSRVVTGSDDGTVRTWLTATGEPFWRGPALLAGPPRLFSHRGWVLLEDDEPASMPNAKWRSRIETEARFAAAAADGEHLCVGTADDFVEVWSMRHDKRLSREAVPDVQGVRATARGCLTHGSTLQARALLIPYAGGRRELATGDEAVTAIGDGPGELLVAAGPWIHCFDLTGQSRGRVTADVGVTAMARINDSTIALGYRDGSLEITRTNKTEISGLTSAPFESTPSSPVTILKAGPRDTVIAGFASGAVGLWTWHDGKSVIRSDIHGRVTHLLVDNGRLYGASDLGAYFKWDLNPFLVDWCGLLEDVWSSVPVIWKNGQAVATPPPAKHSCRQRHP
ncbi:MAG: WD40 repeat domain-containing protein, partial [Polyangiaceae bacterium]